MNKKILLMIFTICLIVVFACALVACSNGEAQQSSDLPSGQTPSQQDGSGHTHSFSSTYSYNSTSHWQSCSCGEKQNYNAHTFGDWVIDRDATEEATGSKHRTCSVCGYVEYGTIDRLTHNHSFSMEYQHDDTHHWHECSCGEKQDYNTHTFDAWVVDREPTNSTTGEKHRICSVCGFIECATIPTIETSSGFDMELSGGGTYYIIDGIGTCQDTNVIIPSVFNGLPVKEIASYAFEDCNRIRRVTVPSSVTKIGRMAFKGCYRMSRLEIHGAIATMGNQILYGCSGLEEMIVYSTETSILSWFDSFPMSLDTVEIKNGTIPDSCFASSSLTTITIGNDVTSIGEYAFSGCTGLTSITIPDSVTSIGEYAFSGCTGLTSITIPDSVTSIGEYVFSGCTGLTSITIPDSVTSIGEYAFSGCTGLTSITIPDSVTSIYCNAFRGCTGLTSITIPGSVTGIGDYAFQDCTDLTSINYTGDMASWCGITGLGNLMQHGNSKKSLYIDGNLVEGDLVIPDVVTTIPSYTFRGCTGLTSVTIGNGVTSIGYSAFSGCSSLVSMTLPFVGDSAMATFESNSTVFGHIFGTTEFTGGTSTQQSYASGSSLAYYIPSSLRSVTVLGGSVAYGAFYNCSMLASITIGNGVTSIGEKAFYGCSSLVNMTIPFVGGFRKTSSDTYQYPLGYIFGTSRYTGGTAVEQKYHVSSTSSTTSTTYYIPSSLRSVTVTGVNILDGAFCNCSMLTSITIPDSVTSIGNYVFYGCSMLTSITIPDGVTSISEYAFRGCAGLTSITIPDSVTSIGESAFEYCTGLTSITIPDSVTSISEYAFRGCTGLTSVTIPSSITILNIGVFKSCIALTLITYKGTMAQWNAIRKLYGDGYPKWDNDTGTYTIHCTDGDIAKY